jgi:hypothetical protein
VERGSDRIWEEPIEEDQTAALRNVGQREASSRGCASRDTPGVRNFFSAEEGRSDEGSSAHQGVVRSSETGH